MIVCVEYCQKPVENCPFAERNFLRVSAKREFLTVFNNFWCELTTYMRYLVVRREWRELADKRREYRELRESLARIELTT